MNSENSLDFKGDCLIRRILGEQEYFFKGVLFAEEISGESRTSSNICSQRKEVGAITAKAEESFESCQGRFVISICDYAGPRIMRMLGGRDRISCAQLRPTFGPS